MKKAAIWVAAAAGVALVLSGCGQNMKVADVPDTVAKVDGQSIPASLYLDQASRRAGREVLTNLIEQSVIVKWAKDEDVAPTKEQIDRQIETYKRDGLYERQVKMMGEDAVKAELEAMQARINVAKKLNKPDDKELQQMYDMMKSRYVHGPRKSVALIINSDKEKVEDAAKAVKEGKSFDDAAAEYSDSRFSMGGGPIELMIENDQPGMPKEPVTAAKKTKVGEPSAVFKFGQPGTPTQYVLMKVIKEQPKSDLKLKDVKDELADAAALQRSQMDPTFQEKLNKKKKDANIEVNIPYLKSVVSSIKNPPPAPMMSQPAPAPKAAPAKPKQ